MLQKLKPFVPLLFTLVVLTMYVMLALPSTHARAVAEVGGKTGATLVTAIFFLFQALVLLGVLSFLELVLSAHSKSGLERIWRRIWWPFVSETYFARKQAKIDNSVTYQIITDKYVTYVGGDYTRVFYKNAACWFKLVSTGETMELVTGPGVKIEHTGKVPTMYKKCYVGINNRQFLNKGRQHEEI